MEQQAELSERHPASRCTPHNRVSGSHPCHLRAPSEDRDKVLNTIPRILGDTLRDPCDSSDLLLLQLEVRVEHRVLELLQEGEFVQVHLSLEESVLQLSRNGGRILRTVAVDARCRRIKEAAILDNIITHLPHLLDLVRLREEVVARGKQAANCGEQPCALLLA